MRKDLEHMLANPRCKTFIVGVLKELGTFPKGVYSTDLMAIFEAIATQPNGGFFSDPSLRPGYANAGGSVKGGNANITFGSIPPWNTTDAHEIFHVAAGTPNPILHTEMARAAFASANAMGLTRFCGFPEARKL